MINGTWRKNDTFIAFTFEHRDSTSKAGGTDMSEVAMQRAI